MGGNLAGIPVVILLFGGTSESAPIALALAEAGVRVFVSLATDVDCNCGTHRLISVRRGPLTEGEIAELIRTSGIRIVIDATHPYAKGIQDNAKSAAQKTGCRYLRYNRPSTLQPNSDVIRAASHDEAALRACGFGKPVLLTTGSKVLAPYIQASKEMNVPLYARILDCKESEVAWKTAGLAPEALIVGRGPFSIEENRRVIRERGIGVLVTKDSGEAGGFREKIEAARLERCMVVVVDRPSVAVSVDSFASVDDLIAAILQPEFKEHFY